MATNNDDTERDLPGLGRRLRQAREAAGLSQAELAERTGLAQAQLSAIETGMIRQPSPENVTKLAAALGIPDPLLTKPTD